MKKHEITSRFRYWMNLLMYSLLVILLFANVAVSQMVNKLYFDVMNGQRESVIALLRALRNTSQYNELEGYYTSKYGSIIASEVNMDVQDREKQIVYYEDLLLLNPKARDVLYNLYVLYRSNGDNATAQNYYERMKQVDPGV